MSTTSTHYGFKRITADNWQEADVPRLFNLTTSQGWIEAHLQAQLSPNVPSEIASLFEVVRGSIIYGWFFYPLVTLGNEQCSRVLEAAVRKTMQPSRNSDLQDEQEGQTERYEIR